MDRKTVRVGHISLGGGHPVVIQSMTNLRTTDVDGILAQLVNLSEAGASIVRLAVQDQRDILALAAIRKRLHEIRLDLPLVADIHFRAQLAMDAAPLVEKIRINPGNIFGIQAFNDPSIPDKQLQTTSSDTARERLLRKLKPVLQRCADTGTSLRIGVNLGSLPRHIEALLGRGPEALVRASMEYIDLFEELQFTNMVISVKASNTATMIAANTLLFHAMSASGRIFPIHLGVTEAGAGIDGRSKSAIGLMPLLKKGIGDTIRVSLTEDPVHEVVFAGKLMEYLSEKRQTHTFSSAAQLLEVIPAKTSKMADPDIMVITLADMLTDYLDTRPPDREVQSLTCHRLSAPVDKIFDSLLQATAQVALKTEIISCPHCGRSSTKTEPILQEIRHRAGHFPGLKIAVMGCVVNGPGEAADADYSLMGHARGTFWLFRRGRITQKNLPPEQAVKALMTLMIQDGYAISDI